MIRAIIFDCFGVLTTEGWLSFKLNHFGHDTDYTREASDLRKQVDGGRLDYSDFVRRITEMAGITAEKFRQAVERNAPNEPLFDLIATELKPKYSIGLLSNAGADRLIQLFGEEKTKLFDAVALSYQTGMVKPQAGAYRDIAEKLEVEPQECLFIDDQERYCTGARDTGMQAIWYKDFDQFKAEIEEILG
jgi:putative hydrolase of the HAD superfamily